VLVTLVLGTVEKEEIMGCEMVIQVRLQRKIQVLHLSSATLLTLISSQRAVTPHVMETLIKVISN
jgi:hypothetical protein